MELYSYQNQAFDDSGNIKSNGTGSASPSFQLLWKDISREVDVSHGTWPFNTVTRRTILNPMSGVIDAGSITALMGPSGAGKTTLLKIIANKVSPKLNGVTGEVAIRHNLPPNEAKSFRIGYVAQNDSFFTEFTIKESLVFASRMINGHLTSEQHQDAVEAVIKKLDLVEVADIPIKRLSGGQVKRTSMGIELMGQPQVLILDEPTSGLDSDSSENVIRVLKTICSQREASPAVLATIHQPSKDVFFLFDNIFLLSRSGHNIYYGSPERVLDFFESFGHPSPHNESPAEFMIEFANGKHGKQSFEQMAQQTFEETRGIYAENKYSLKSDIQVKKLRMKTSTSFMTEIWLLFSRHVSKQTMKSNWTLLKLMTGMFVAILVFATLKNPIGKMDGCWSSLSLFGKNSDGDSNISFLSLFQSLKAGTLFTIVLVMYQLFISALAVVFVFHDEWPTYMKEMSNSWYSPSVFVISQFFSNSLHQIITFLPVFSFIYWITSQPLDIFDRPIIISVIVLVFGFVNETKGEIISIIFSKYDIMVPMIVTVVSTLPTTFLSGWTVRVQHMTDFLRPVAQYNDMTNAIESVMITTYGMGRCKPLNDTVSSARALSKNLSFQSIAQHVWSNFNGTSFEVRGLSVSIGLDPDYLDPVVDSIDGFMNRSISTSSSNSEPDSNPSFMLDTFGIREEDFLSKICVIVAYLFAVKIIFYLLLRHRVSSSNN